MYVGCEADFMMEFFQNKIASLQFADLARDLSRVMPMSLTEGLHVRIAAGCQHSEGQVLPVQNVGPLAGRVVRRKFRDLSKVICACMFTGFDI